ncbi:MAG: tail fiber protein [Arachnia sp.]
MDPILGELRLFGFMFAPSGWASCQGQLMPISSNTALYSLLGTTYGGDGRTNFALPDLRGRLPLGSGHGPGLSDYTQGQLGGQEQVTLQAGQLPAHNHTVAASSSATGKNPSNAFPAVTPDGVSYGTSADMSMNPTMVGGGGAGQPHENRQPFIALNWCIATQGVYPSRP